MCGIIAVLQKSSEREPPSPEDLSDGLEQAEAVLADARASRQRITEHLRRAHEHLTAVDEPLRGTPGLLCLLQNPEFRAEVETRTGRLTDAIEDLEHGIDSGTLQLDDDIEQVNAALLKLKDVVWAISVDRLGHARGVARLARTAAAEEAAGEASAEAPGELPKAAVEAYSAIEFALDALDRLEVRGRDSAGIHILVRDHGLDLDRIAPELQARREPFFRNRAIRAPNGHLCFVYKVAREVGELGDNTRALRATIAGDTLLRRALESDAATVTVLGHTRWASVGLINEANAHPVNQEQVGGSDAPYVVAALNGDVDNHRTLTEEHGLEIAPEITTDAKVIPTLAARAIARGMTCEEAFRETAALFEGSVAIAANAAGEPSKLMLALRGSGQTLCVGVAEDMYIVASEPYGVVEVTPSYLRMDGEAVCEADGSQGQVVILDAEHAGEAEHIARFSYAGAPLHVGPDDLLSTDITTRDIDRGAHRHFFIKEISESPATMRKTLRGRIREVYGRRQVHLSPQTIPASLRERLGAGTIRRIFVVGQGTAAVAARGVAASIASALRATPIEVIAEPATELSAFGLGSSMSDTLVVAVTQSGTTTDTNRAVDLARRRGALVIAIVNRRNSDITHKVDGVLYTSDGRDIEMSVASTKAFYSQIAAGFLLAFALADAIGIPDPDADALLAELSRLPDAMDEVLDRRAGIRALAQELAPRKRHWAVVGNGRNLVAAHEIRIKMSELCYKSIALDVTEDKKHIDLSSEPMTFVCATGLSGSAAADVAKEVAILRAHKGIPVVVATDGATAFAGEENLISVPPVHPDLSYVLSTMAGHLFGYEAAIAIDTQARPLRQARELLDTAAASANGANPLTLLNTRLAKHIGEFRQNLWAGRYDAALLPGTTSHLVSLFSYVEGTTPLDLYDREFGHPGSPTTVVEDLTSALTVSIDDLTRSVDTIRHQAKTVTVGTSRSDEDLFTLPLVNAVIDAGATRERLSYVNLQTLAALNPAVSEVTGYSRYEISRDPATGAESIALVDQGGVVKGAGSRTSADHTLRGHKQIVAEEREVLLARGRNDGRLVLFVPEVSAGVTTGMVLLHVALRDRLEAGPMRRVLDGYRRRLAGLTGAVTESEGTFDDGRLGEIDVETLLTEPISLLANRWTPSHRPAG